MGQRNQEKQGKRACRATTASRRAKLERMFGARNDVKGARSRVKEAIK